VTHSSDINTPRGQLPEAIGQADDAQIATSDASGEVSVNAHPDDTGETLVDLDQRSDDDTHDSVVVRKSERIREKVRVARAHLERLPKTDRRARLLHAAVVRRDEVLLDALLQELES